MCPQFLCICTFFGLQVIDAITATQQEAGTLSLDFFRNHESPSWKTDDLVTDKSMYVDGKANAENGVAEHDLPTNKSPKDSGTNINMNFRSHFPSSIWYTRIKFFSMQMNIKLTQQQK
jgi:hypothetical protein